MRSPLNNKLDKADDVCDEAAESCDDESLMRRDLSFRIIITGTASCNGRLSITECIHCSHW